MITDSGTKLIGKYLAGTINSPFEYLALGCGPTPEVDWTEDTTITRLGMETVRVPVLETSYVESGVDSYLSLSGIVPSELRYEFSEVGVYPAERNSGIVSPGSKTLSTFSGVDGWEIRDSTGIDTQPPLLDPASNGEGSATAASEGTETAYFANADDQYFFFPGRLYQSSRVGNKTLLIRGDMSEITVGSGQGDFTVVSGSDKLRLDTSVSLAGAKYDDDLVLSFAVLTRDFSDIESGYEPDEIRIIVEFSESASSTNVARMEIKATDNSDGYDFANNGYYTVSVPFSGTNDNGDIIAKSAGFSWSNISVINIYVEADPNSGSALSGSDYFVLIDSLRFASNNSTNPNYGMVAYSVVENQTSSTVVKNNGQNRRFEYRIGLNIA